MCVPLCSNTCCNLQVATDWLRTGTMWPHSMFGRGAGTRSYHVRYTTVGAPPRGFALPLDVEETVTCFCRKARRKEREGDGSQGDPKLYLEETLLERKLPDMDVRDMVELPDGIDQNEWLASHTLALFDHVNLIYGTVSEFCTATLCPDMAGPGARAYPWFDEKGKKTRVAAPQYVDYVMTFTQKTVSDESIFPTKYANDFPTSFESIVRKILRLLFHVVAHLYAAHFREVVLLGLHTHLNLTFAHLTALDRRFNLIEPKETDVLRDLEIALRLTDEGSTSTTESAQSVAQQGQGESVACSGAVDGDASLRPIVEQPGVRMGAAPAPA